MKKLFSIALILIGLGSLSAQSFVWKSNFNPVKNSQTVSSNGSLKILAVMVEFQQDNDGNTYGNGKFGSIYTQAYGDTILDPLPHDKKYFENRLEFAKNYFTKVSGGKLNIEYTVLPQVITVSKVMREYSPPPTNSSDLTNLGSFVQEVWQLAGTNYSDVDFSQYDLFTIFHAGVGREFTPPGSIGGERDIPSIYFGLNSLKSIFGDSFSGFPVNNFNITNTMILPSTESREIESLSSKTLVQLTTNGLVAASIASHLGLPDLFNTETGTSAIGRLGLMDGEAIFGYSGVFPPEPSAWEKIYMGWARPKELFIKDNNVNIVAHLVAGVNDTTILKIPINSTEYYLVENRQRDVRNDGIKITSKIGDQVITYNIDRDKGRFQWYGVDTLRGVITDIDEFDWAVPGNGIIIWHIDEKIINEKIAENKINVDINNKGIDVEEADGIQDIGEKFTDIFGETVIGQAIEDDFWFSGNTSRLYKNKFSYDTKPNTKANTGANSLITMENFTAANNRMNFKISFSTDYIKILSSVKLKLIDTLRHFNCDTLGGDNFIYMTDNHKLYKFDKYSNGKQFIVGYHSSVKPIIVKYKSKDYVVTISEEHHLSFRWEEEFENDFSIDFYYPITALSADIINDEEPIIYMGTKDGRVYKLPITHAEEYFYNDMSRYLIYNFNEPVVSFSISDSMMVILTSKKIIEISSSEHSVVLPYKPIKSILSKNSNGQYFSVILCEGNKFIIVGGGQILSEFNIDLNDTIKTFSLSNLNNNSKHSILLTSRNNLYAYDLNGVIEENYPIEIKLNENFKGEPLSIDIENDGLAEIISFTDKGSIYAFNGKTTEELPGFPLNIGTEIISSPLIFNYDANTANDSDNKKGMMVVGKDNRLYTWIISNYNSQLYWSGSNGDAYNTSFVNVATGYDTNADFFPSERAYNWPNPVYENETNIRYYVSEDSDVTIRIFDLAGDLVANLSDRATGGYDNETTWNVSSVQSGVYYASIEVKSNSGKTANKVIKIAVIK